MNCREAVSQMAGYVPGEQPRDRRYIKLNTNENPYPPTPKIQEALTTFAPERLRLYPDPVATALREEAGNLVDLPPEWVLCGNGSDDLLTIAVRTFVDQKARLACPVPSYSLYPVLAQIQDAETVQIPLDDHFELPQDAATRAKGCSLMFVARPNAPTGNAFPRTAMRQLCATFTGIVWIDEAYAAFADDNCLDFVRDYPNVVVSRTLSKSYSLAGLRLGIAYAQPALITEMMKVKDSYNVNMLTQLLGIAALRDAAWMNSNTARIRASRTWLRDALVARGFEVLPSQANFVFTAPPLPAADYVAGLRKAGILVRYFPGERTGCYVRITIGTPPEMEALIEATDAVLAARED